MIFCKTKIVYNSFSKFKHLHTITGIHLKIFLVYRPHKMFIVVTSTENDR